MINVNKTKHFSFQFIFIMFLFLLIAVLSVMIILLGKDIYSSINEDRAANYDRRVSLSYMANKIRQSDKENSVRIENLNGENAIVINETYDDENYETWIYFYDNAIYEMFTDAGSEFSPDDGMRILEVESLGIEKLKDNLYKFTTKVNGESTELVLNLYSY
ncbi:MAG TPA: hypothetical protein DCM73_00140 [Clostridiales bacterium]|nr:hypothetical protein [Clostridiales bacterium]